MRDALGRFIKGNNFQGGLPSCPDCGKKLGDYSSKHCSVCAAKYIKRKDISGNRNPFWGKKHSSKTKKEISSKVAGRFGKQASNWKGGVSIKYRVCIDCGCKLGSHDSVRCSRCNGVKHRCSGHWNWSGGITVLSDLIRNTAEYQSWRVGVFERDNYTCKECGRFGCYLQAHHIKEFYILLREFLVKYNQFSPIEDKETLSRLSMSYDPFWDIDNGETLCEECHNLTKKGYSNMEVI